MTNPGIAVLPDIMDITTPLANGAKNPIGTVRAYQAIIEVDFMSYSVRFVF